MAHWVGSTVGTKSIVAELVEMVIGWRDFVKLFAFLFFGFSGMFSGWDLGRVDPG